MVCTVLASRADMKLTGNSYYGNSDVCSAEAAEVERIER